MVKKGKKDFTSGLDYLIKNPATKEDDAAVPETVETPSAEIQPEKPAKSKSAKGVKERQLTITIPENLKRSIKEYCAKNDMTIKDLFINSVSRYMG